MQTIRGLTNYSHELSSGHLADMIWFSHLKSVLAYALSALEKAEDTVQIINNFQAIIQQFIFTQKAQQHLRIMRIRVVVKGRKSFLPKGYREEKWNLWLTNRIRL